MPELATHLAAQMGANSFVKGRALAVGALLGAAAPDASKPLIRLAGPWGEWWFFAWHSPLFLLVLLYAASLLFVERQRPAILAGALFGAGLHLFLDHLQKHVAGGSYFLFFPFSFKTSLLGLFPPEASLAWLPLTLAVALLLVYWRKNAPRKS